MLARYQCPDGNYNVKEMQYYGKNPLLALGRLWMDIRVVNTLIDHLQEKISINTI